MSKLTKALDEHPNQKDANAIRLQLLTVSRIGEVLGAKWSEIDFERSIWVKPSHQRTEHLPLSGAALRLLKTMQEVGLTSEFLFLGKNPKPSV